MTWARMIVLWFVMFTFETHVTLGDPIIYCVVGSRSWNDLFVIKKYLITTLVSNLGNWPTMFANISRVVGSWSWCLPNFLFSIFGIANCGSSP